MSSNVDLIYTRLFNDATLVGTLDVSGGNHYTGLAKGGVWTKPLKRLSPGKTEYAFVVDDNDDEKFHVRPSVVILDRGDRRHRQADAIPGAYVQTVWIYYYAPATQSGKDAIKNMRGRVYDLLDFDASGWTFASEDGPVVFASLLDRHGIHDSEAFESAVEDYQRFQLTSRYGNII